MKKHTFVLIGLVAALAVPGLAQNGYQAQPNSTRPAAPPTPPKTTSSVVKPKD